jgi:hypothetical protein
MFSGNSHTHGITLLAVICRNQSMPTCSLIQANPHGDFQETVTGPGKRQKRSALFIAMMKKLLSLNI